MNHFDREGMLGSMENCLLAALGYALLGGNCAFELCFLRVNAALAMAAVFWRECCFRNISFSLRFVCVMKLALTVLFLTLQVCN